VAMANGHQPTGLEPRSVGTGTMHSIIIVQRDKEIGVEGGANVLYTADAMGTMKQGRRWGGAYLLPSYLVIQGIALLEGQTTWGLSMRHSSYWSQSRLLADERGRVSKAMTIAR
jgi:hypothetical protein